MWYEILPCIGVIMFSLWIPQGLNVALNKTVFGNHYRRHFADDWDYLMCLRDSDLTGSYLKRNGLETIPDE